MKKVFLFAIAALAMWSCGSKTQYTLNGEVIPASDGQIVLYTFSEGSASPVDTAEMVAGKFTFTGDVTIPELAMLGVAGENRPVAQMFLEPGKIDMTIYPDSFEGNTVVASKANEIFKIFNDEMLNIAKSQQALEGRYTAAVTSNNEEEINAVRFEYETMIDNAQLFAKNFVGEYSESPVAAFVYVTQFFQDADLDELDSMLTVFEPIKDADFVKIMQKRADAMRGTSEGASAPDFTLTDPNGNPVSLSALKGKYVLIDFWASWCQPCMVEMPNVIEQYNTYKDKGFEIIGVSLDRERDAWLNTIEEKGMNWLHGWDMESETPGAVAEKYQVQGIPHTVLVDKEGKIIANNLRGPALKAKLAELLD